MLIYRSCVNQCVNQDLLNDNKSVFRVLQLIDLYKDKELVKDARMRGCEGLKILWPVMAVRVQVPLRVLGKALVSQ